jgi:membrane protein DedA with SNARE-associated domain
MADKAVLYLRAEDMLVKRPFFIIFISKFLYGFNHLLIVKAASSGIEFGKFMRVNVLATFLWIALVGGLGYLFGASFYSFKKLMHYAEFAVLAFIILFPFIERLISGLIFKVSGKKSGGVLENRVEN